MTYAQVVTYLWLVQAMLRMAPWDVDRDVAGMIRSGAVVYELLRPIDLYNLWFCRALSLRSMPTVLRAIPIFLVAMPFFGMQAPSSFASGFAWLIATIGALVLSSAITTILSISLLWTISGLGITRLVTGIVIIFSGMIVPLPLFPSWAQPMINAMPFRGLMDTPFRLYIGHISPEHVVFVIAHQLAWSFALILLGRYILARGLHKLVVQGG
jgi:ABC-2 type transport system permease protein